jgi:hypothetical protein
MTACHGLESAALFEITRMTASELPLPSDRASTSSVIPGPAFSSAEEGAGSATNLAPL